MEAWETTLGGSRCELVTVVGDPGVGKSRLVAEALAQIDARVVRGRCLSYGDGITYWPVVEVVKQLDRAAERRDGGERRSGRCSARATRRSGTDEIAWAFRKLLEEQAPLVVCFDDIQWAEETFLDLVESIALLSTGAPLLLVCMARPELLDRRPGWPVTLRLEPLPDGGGRRPGRRRRLGGVRQRIVRASGGNPLFLTEMVALSDAGRRRRSRFRRRCGRCWRRGSTSSTSRSGTVLERGAVEGELFHRGAVQALAPEETEVTPRLAALVRRELVRPDRPLAPARGRLPLPPPPDPRRRLRRPPQGDPRRPARPLRRLAGGARPEPGRAGRDRRLPPRAGLPVPRRSGPAPRRRAAGVGPAAPD